MKRATTDAVKKVIQPYLCIKNGISTIKNADAENVTDLIMNEFSGVYCGILEHKSGALILSITSAAKTRKKFLEVLVDDSNK